MSELVISVNIVYISLIDSPSFIVNNSNLCTNTEILDFFTLFVPSCVTSNMCQISCAVLQFDTLLNLFLSKAQNNAFIAFALVCINFLSFAVHASTAVVGGVYSDSTICHISKLKDCR